MKIGNQNFSSKSPLFVAEISGNHAGDLNILKKTIVAAIKSGANAIKLQTYTPEDLTIKSNNKTNLQDKSYRKILFLLNELSNAWWQHLENKSNRRSKKPKLLAILCQRYLIMIEHYEYYVTSYSK